SRYWSAWMTLEHLRIVNHQIARVISSLAAGIEPSGKVSTAKVKPSKEANAAVIAEYEKACDELATAVAAVPDLKTKVRYTHPWFGPLDAYGWHALSAG